MPVQSKTWVYHKQLAPQGIMVEKEDESKYLENGYCQHLSDLDKPQPEPKKEEKPKAKKKKKSE